jgi:hypothetical protein
MPGDLASSGSSTSHAGWLADDATLEKFAGAVMQIVRLLIDEVVNGYGVHCIDMWRPVLPFIKVFRQKLSIEFTLFPTLPILHFLYFAEMYENQVASDFRRRGPQQRAGQNQERLEKRIGNGFRDARKVLLCQDLNSSNTILIPQFEHSARR